MKCKRRNCQNDVDGKTLCDAHLEAQKEAQKRYRLKRKAGSEDEQEIPPSDDENVDRKDSSSNDRPENVPSVVRKPKKSRLYSFSRSGPIKTLGVSMENSLTNSNTIVHAHDRSNNIQMEESDTHNLELTKSVTGSKSIEKSAVGEYKVLKEEITEWYEDVTKPDGTIIKVKKITREVEKGKRVEQDSESFETSVTARAELIKSSYRAHMAIREARMKAILDQRQEEQQQAEIYKMLQSDFENDDEDEILELEDEEEYGGQWPPEEEEEEYDSEVEIRRQEEERARKRQKREEQIRENSLYVVLEPGEPIPEEHPDDVILPNHPLELFKKQYWEKNKNKYREGVTAEILWDSLPRDERVYPEYKQDKDLYKSTYSVMEYGRCVTEHRIKNKKSPRTCYFSYNDKPDVVVSTLESKWDSMLWGQKYTPDIWSPDIISLQYKRGVVDPSLVPKEKWDRHLLQCWLDRDDSLTTHHLDPRLDSVESIVVHSVPIIKDTKRMMIMDRLNLLAGVYAPENKDIRVEYAICRFEGVPHTIPVLTSFVKAKPSWCKKLLKTPIQTKPIHTSLLNEQPLWTYLIK